MGVNACDRTDCEHVCCDRCICDSHYYICNDCFSELVTFKETWPTEMYAIDVTNKIKEFMATSPGTHKMLDSSEIDKEFNRLCRRYNEYGDGD